MHNSNFDDITLALAGILQAISLTKTLSQTGRVDETAFEASLHSIFQLNPDNMESIFGSLTGVKLGLEKVVQTFDISQPVDQHQQRYMYALIHIQKKLARKPKLLAALSERIAQIQKQVNYFSLTHPTVIANLADTYLTTVGSFKFRIIIFGTPRVLHAKENLDKVRALLLAGLRSAVLWRQVGGSRLQILFSRAKIKASAEKLLRKIEQQEISQKDTI